MSANEMAYFAQMPCGCVVMAAVDGPEYAKENAKTIAGSIRRGLVIGRGTVDEVRAMKWGTHAHVIGRIDCDGNPLRANTSQLAMDEGVSA